MAIYSPPYQVFCAEDILMSDREVRYFITGGTGFIGSHLVDRLIEGGWVTVYDNLSSGKVDFIEPHLKRRNFKLIKADLLDMEVLKKSIIGHDVVFHLAANPEVKAGYGDTELDLKNGIIATYNLLEAMRINKVGKIVFTSSSAVYGEITSGPVSEEKGPLPISLYAAAKLASEGLISAYSHLFNIQGLIFRMANVVGPRLTHGIIFDFITKLRENPKELEILGDGRQQKPYLYIDDCIDGMLFAFKEIKEQVGIFNLSPSSSTKAVTIAEMVVEAMGLRDVKFKYTGGERGWPGDVPKVELDTTKMRKLGWSPKYSSDEAIKKTIEDILGKRY